MATAPTMTTWSSEPIGGRTSPSFTGSGLFRRRLAFRDLSARDIDHELGELGRVARAFEGFVGQLLFSCQFLECLAIHSAACCSVPNPLIYFRLTIRPENIYYPAKSGIFSRHENGPVFGHLVNMRLRRSGSSLNRMPYSKEPTTNSHRVL
jgi:hypothetical protein